MAEAAQDYKGRIENFKSSETPCSKGTCGLPRKKKEVQEDTNEPIPKREGPHATLHSYNEGSRLVREDSGIGVM